MRSHLAMDYQLTIEKQMIKKKIILICSDDEEGSTDIVCSYLNALDKKFIRFSDSDKIKIENVFIENNNIDFTFILKGKSMNYSDISSYWYRRSEIAFETFNIDEKFMHLDADITKITNDFQNSEYVKLTSFIEYMFNKKAKLNRFEDNHINKLIVLEKATSFDLLIPSTYIANNKKYLSSKDNYITKAISDLFAIDKRANVGYSVKTERIKKNDILYDEFFYTLFQKEIKKAFELRIFFMNNSFYSSAIFSQSNAKTEVDFRNYDDEKPNRVEPFILPIKIESQLRKLLDSLKLISGSIDMIVTSDYQYIFLEVNPVGQFEQVTFPCRYNIHKKIAELL